MTNNLNKAAQNLLKLTETREAMDRLRRSAFERFFKQMEDFLEPLRRQQEEIQRLYEPLRRQQEEIQKLFEPLRRQQEKIQKSLEPLRAQQDTITNWLSSMTPVLTRGALGLPALDHLQEILEGSTRARQPMVELAEAHSTWLKSGSLSQMDLGRVQIMANEALARTLFRTTVTESLVARISQNALRSSVTMSAPGFKNAREALLEARKSYEGLVSSIDSVPGVLRLPSETFPSAAREDFLSVHTVVATVGSEKLYPEERLLVAEVKQESSECVELLALVDRRLVKLYMGARDALTGRSVDRARHVLISLRELTNHLLRLLAPNERVLEWIRIQPRDNLLHDGQPTRRARLLYLLRGVSSDPLENFVDRDTGAMIELLKQLNRVHKLDPGLNRSQLESLVLRVESWIVFIVKVATQPGQE